MYIHYIIGLLCIFIALLHAIAMHYDYRDYNFFDGIENEVEWFDITFKNELFKCIDFCTILFLYTRYIYNPIEPLSYEIFMWGDVGYINDVRFLGVAPHWYFRTYMGWLLLCPHHYLGVFGFIFLMVIVYFQPNIKNNAFVFLKINTTALLKPETSMVHIITFSIFTLCILYTDSFLPYGKFFNALGGNFGLLLSYVFIYLYMSVPVYKYVYIVFFSKLSI